MWRPARGAGISPHSYQTGGRNSAITTANIQTLIESSQSSDETGGRNIQTLIESSQSSDETGGRNSAIAAANIQTLIESSQSSDVRERHSEESLRRQGKLVDVHIVRRKSHKAFEVILTTRAAKLRRCAKCERVAYCNAACQKEHWKQHKKDCKKWSTASEA
ncbi:hypothetical protein T484DRAFT_1792258 [Baffinella frigidus]|nr:hypothetical protein T484DRAFT_1792258 [Cryptophyta sp. CCMP2293]